MNELFSQLGIDWRLLLSQAANFLILLIVLRAFAYAPLMKLLKERRARIEEGLEHAKEADRRLAESNAVMIARMKDAEREAMALMHTTEQKAKTKEAEMMKVAEHKQTEMIKHAERMIDAKAEDMRKKVEAEAAGLVKAAIAKTVEMDPKMVDETLIARAIGSLKK